MHCLKDQEPRAYILIKSSSVFYRGAGYEETAHYAGCKKKYMKPFFFYLESRLGSDLVWFSFIDSVCSL